MGRSVSSSGPRRRRPSPDAYYNLGMVQGKAERYDDAVQNLQKYLDLAPTASDAEEGEDPYIPV